MREFRGVLRPVRQTQPDVNPVLVEPLGDEQVPVTLHLVEPENTFIFVDQVIDVSPCPGAVGHGVFDREGRLMTWWASIRASQGGRVVLRSAFPAPGFVPPHG